MNTNMILVNSLEKRKEKLIGKDYLNPEVLRETLFLAKDGCKSSLEKVVLNFHKYIFKMATNRYSDVMSDIYLSMGVIIKNIDEKYETGQIISYILSSLKNVLNGDKMYLKERTYKVSLISIDSTINEEDDLCLADLLISKDFTYERKIASDEREKLNEHVKLFIKYQLDSNEALAVRRKFYSDEIDEIAVKENNMLFSNVQMPIDMTAFERKEAEFLKSAKIKAFSFFN